MTNSVRPVIVATLCLAAAAASPLTAQSRFQYRTYEMGEDRRTIAEQIGMPLPPDVVLTRALGVVEELQWRAEYGRRGAAVSGDSVAKLAFSFYEDQLFRIVIDYAPDRTEGMTEADLVAAVSKVYGPPTKRAPLPDRVGWQLQRADDVVVAMWTERAYPISLLALPGPSTFRLIVSSSRLEALARAAGSVVGPADAEDGTSYKAGTLHPLDQRTPAARETTRRANIASFVP
jgi:hypothetical protein